MDQKDANVINNDIIDETVQRCNSFLQGIYYNKAEFEIINILEKYYITPPQAKQMFAELESYIKDTKTITCGNDDGSIIGCYNDDGSLLIF